MNNVLPIQVSGSSIWEASKNALKKQLGQATFNSWIKPLSFIDYQNGILKISAPTKFIRDWVESHYGNKIRLVSNGNIRQLEIEVNAVAAEISKGHLSETSTVNLENENNVVSLAKYNESISSRIDPRFTFENFITDKSNELAYAAAKRIAEQGHVAGLNPLFLHSGVGLGKTHLMHATANYSQKNSAERKVIYLSAEKFLHQYVRSLKERSILQFKEDLRSADILMIDDFQFIAGKESTQEEFFHTVTSLVEAGKQIIISCDRSPSEFNDLPERMRSRLSSGLVADIDAAGYDLRLRILKAKATDSGAAISDDILEFLSTNITSNIRELEGALNRIIARATLINMEINIDNAKTWLADLLKIKQKQISIDEIQEKIANRYGIKVSELLSSSRSKNIARPRQIAMYIAKNLTTKSLVDIGKLFGGKDHTTVIHACRKIEKLITSDESTASEIQSLTSQIKAC